MRYRLIGGAFAAAAMFASAHAALIDFESLSNGDVVTNQFAGVVFSSAGGKVNMVTAQPGIGFGSNFICTGPSGGGIDCVGETILTFASGVSGLSFYQVGDNASGVVALVDVFVNNVFSSTVNIMGFNDFFVPNLVDLTAFSNVTSIRIYSITDPGGLGWDNFSFDIDGREVPLPGAAWLFLAGLGALSARRKRMRPDQAA